MRRKSSLPAVLLAATLASLVGACQTASDLQEAFIGDDTPDEEYASVGGPKLTLPPDYNLRPPESGSGASDANTAALVARKQVFSLAPQQQQASLAAPGGVPGRPSRGEIFLLERAGIASVNPNIREEVEIETTVIDETDNLMVEKLLKWRDSSPEGEVVVSVDGTIVEEEPVDDIPPVIIRKRRGLLESIF